MLLPVTVLDGGKTNKTVVRAIYDRETYYKSARSVGLARLLASYNVGKPPDGTG